MTWLAIRLFMGKALTAVLNALRWLMAHPWQAACIGLVCVSAWQYATIGRLNGRLVQREAVITRQNALIAEMQAKAEHARAKSVTIAKDADNADTINRADNRARTRTHFAANRLPDQGRISAPAEGSLTQGDQDAPAVRVMALSEADAMIVADLQTYANTCHKWAVDMVRADLAD